MRGDTGDVDRRLRTKVLVDLPRYSPTTEYKRAIPLPSDQIGRGFLVCSFFLSFSSFICFFGCSDGMEREACVCDHGFERSDLRAEIIIPYVII